MILLYYYYALFHLYLLYGLIIRFNTYKPYTNKMTGLQYKAMISNSKRTDKCSPIYKNLEILNIQDLHFFETAVLMFKFHSKKLPISVDLFYNTSLKSQKFILLIQEEIPLD